MNLVDKKLRVKHFPQIPCKAFEVEVKNEREAYLMMETLADQHNFLYQNAFIPDFSNIILLEMWDEDLDADGNGDKWTDYYNEKEVMDWDEFKEEYPEYLNGYDLDIVKETHIMPSGRDITVKKIDLG